MRSLLYFGVCLLWLCGHLVAQPDLSLAGRIVFQTTRDGNDEIYFMEADGTNLTRLTNNASGEQNPGWSPTGDRVVYQTDRDGNWEIYAIQDDGTNDTNLTSNAALDGSPSWSPDGSRIAFQTNRDGNFEIYLMDADGSNPSRLTSNAADDLSPKWSPDGTQIVFQSLRDGDYETYVMNANGSNQTRLTTDAGSDELAEWSPDGTRIAWSTNRDGNYEIYTMDPDGTNATRITNHAGVDFQPTWSADGTKIVWKTNRDGNDEIYIMSKDGSGPTNLTSNGAIDAQPSWYQLRSVGKTVVGFPLTQHYKLRNTGGATLNISSITSSSGLFTLSPTTAAVSSAGDIPLLVTFSPASAGNVVTTLTVSSDDPSDPAVNMIVTGTAVDEPELQVVGDVVFTTDRDGNNEIYVMDLDGTGQTRLTNDGGDDHSAQFSADGGQVFWQTDRDGNMNVYRMDGNGANPMALTTDAAVDGEPSVSPDGSQVAFSTNRDGNYEIYTMFSNGTSQVNITSHAANDRFPRWAPDGSKILFTTDRDGNEEVYSMNPDGTGAANLTSDAGADNQAQFSPDGTRIAFTSGRDGDQEIFLMDANGANPTQVTKNTTSDHTPTWSPDGTRVMFTSNRFGSFDVFSIDTGHGKLFRLTSNAASDTDPDFAQVRSIGQVEVNTPVVRSVYVSNRGNATLNVTNITSSDPQFVLSAASLAIPASSQYQLDVTFTPTSPGFFVSTLTLTSDDPVTPTATLKVSGKGFVPDPDLLLVADLVYMSDRDGNDELYKQNMEMPTEVRLTNDAGSDTDPHVSPDGSKIAFSTNRDGNYEIYTINSDGSSPTRLTNDAGMDIRAAWSPTGKQLAFQTNRDGNEEIYVMDADGTNLLNLTSHANNDFQPRWSPDGTKIVFDTDRDGNNEIYVMDASGANPTRLTNDAGIDREADWSPDGTRIAFVTDRDGNDEIYVMDADGTNLTRMTNDAGIDESPTWSPEGSKIAFRSDRDGDGEIWIMSATGASTFQFVINGNNEDFPSWGNFRLMGESPAGIGISRAMRIFNPGIGDLVVSSIVSVDPQFTFAPSSFTVPEGTGQTVSVTYGPTASTFATSLFTITSNDSDVPVAKLTANGTGLANGGTPTVIVDALTIDFDSTAVGSLATLPLAIKNQGAGLLNITSLSVAGNGFTLSSSGPGTVVVGDSLVVTASLTPPAIGLLVGEISIFHDDGNTANPLVVSVKGPGVDAVPVPSVSAIGFGEVQRLDSRTILVAISNAGNIPIQITNVDPDSGVFKGDPDSLSIDIGTAVGILEVTFSPDSSITFADTLKIYHNGSTSPLRIPLSGSGVPEPPPPAPILAFGLVSLDAGTVQLGATAHIPMGIVNSGDDTLKVTGISANIGGVAFSTTAFNLLPGADTTVTVDVAPTAAGSIAGSVTVTHNGAGSPSSIAIAGAAVLPEVGFTETAVDFGPVQAGTTPEITATLVNNSSQALAVSHVIADAPFTTRVGPFSLLPGNEKTIPVRFDPSSGDASGFLRLLHDNAHIGPLELPLSATVLGTAFETGPAELFLVDPGVGQTVRDTLSFTNLTDSTLTVSASTSDGRFSVSPANADVTAGSSEDFIVTYLSDGSGKTSGALILDHNAPGSPPAVIPLIVQAGKAEIAFGMNSLQFESVDVGDSASAVVVVRNPGSDSLFVNGVTGGSGQTGRFLAEPSHFAVAPGDSLEVTVRFVPDGPGSFADFLAFEANVGLGDPTRVLPGVSAIGVGKGAALAIAPDRLFFATQDATGADSLAITVTNVGNDSLRVFSVETLTAHFGILPDPFVLGEGQSRRLEVIYTPDSTIARRDTILLLTNVQDTVRIPLESAEIPRNVGKASLSLSRLDSLMSPQVGDTVRLSLDLVTGGDALVGADVFIGIPGAFFAVANPASPFTRAGLTQSGLVLVNSTAEDVERNTMVASLSTAFFSPATANGRLARIDLVVIAPLEGPAPVAVLSEFPVHNSQYLVTSPAGEAFTFKATEPLAFGNLPPRFLSLPLLKTEEDGSAELFMNSRVIDPDGPFSGLVFSFTPPDTLMGVVVRTLLDSLVTVVFFPPPDAHGVFSVQAIATDAGGASDTAVVLIDVAPGNDPPTARPDTLLVRGGGFITIPVLNRVNDIDGDSLGVSSVTAATEGSAVLNDDHTVTFTPDPGYNGESSFSYVVTDGHGGTVTGTIVLNVVGTNQRPVMAGLPVFAGVQDSPFVFVLTQYKSDPDDSSHVLAWGVDVLSGPASSARVDGDLLEVFPLPGRIGEIRILLALFDPFGAVTAREKVVKIDPATRIGDFNGDSLVDFVDLLIISRAWGTKDGEEGFVPLADLDFNGVIGFPDFRVFAAVF